MTNHGAAAAESPLAGETPEVVLSRDPRRQGLSASSRATYAAAWAFFTDWCAAADRDALPASPATVLEFLHDNPAAPATARRRVVAIDHHHRDAGHPLPGHDSAVMAWLRKSAGRPAEPKTRRLTGDQMQAVLRRIPSHGWPAGLSGRRDRLLALLAHAGGLTRAELQQLRITDLTVESPAEERPAILVIHPEHGPMVRLPGTAAADVCPPCVWLAWHRVLNLADHCLGNRPLRQAFARTQPFTADAPHYCHTNTQPHADLSGWVFRAADQHGYLNEHRALSIRAISHLRTTAGSREYRIQPAPAATEESAAVEETTPIPEPRARTRDEIQAAHGTALTRQRRERQQLAKLDDIFGDLDRRIAEWTAAASALTDPTPLTAER